MVTHELSILARDEWTITELTLTDEQATFLAAIVELVNVSRGSAYAPQMSLDLKS